jgi:glycosyltransferase involved in cell wall biosynthesis
MSVDRPAGRTSGPRVCHIVATADGANWVIEQLRELRDRYGYDVTAIVASVPGPLAGRLRAAGIRTIEFDFKLSKIEDVKHIPETVVRLARLLRRERFDVVQTHLFASMVIGRLASWLADVPVRVSMIAGPFHLDAPISRWIDGDTAWMDTLLIGCCRHIVQTYKDLGVKDDRLALVYYGPDETRFDPASTAPSKIREEYGWPEDTPLITQVAWFYHRVQDNRWSPPLTRGKSVKGHSDLIRATALILKEFPNAKVLLIGQGWRDTGIQLQEEMKALVRKLGLEESVIFTGFRPTIPDVLAASDVAVQPSLSEGCGGAFEALLMERPTVGTRVGGIPDMVIDGETGVLVNPADPEDLARGILELLRDPERAKALGRAGRQHVLATATLSKTVADLDRLYRIYLSRVRKRRSGYRGWLSLVRLPIAALVGAYLVARFQIVEIYVNGQRNLHPGAARTPWTP